MRETQLTHREPSWRKIFMVCFGLLAFAISMILYLEKIKPLETEDITENTLVSESYNHQKNKEEIAPLLFLNFMIGDTQQINETKNARKSASLDFGYSNSMTFSDQESASEKETK